MAAFPIVLDEIWEKHVAEKAFYLGQACLHSAVNDF